MQIDTKSVTMYQQPEQPLKMKAKRERKKNVGNSLVFVAALFYPCCSFSISEFRLDMCALDMFAKISARYNLLCKKIVNWKGCVPLYIYAIRICRINEVMSVLAAISFSLLMAEYILLQFVWTE